MLRIAAASATILFVSALTVHAEQAPSNVKMQEGRSVGLCSPSTLVCAVMKDGTLTPASDCVARQSGAVHIIPGDCYGPD